MATKCGQNLQSRGETNMRIVFYANHPYWGQLNNTGGCRTMLLSADSLRKLGHHCDVVAMVDKFSWFDHPAPISKIPHDTDAVIAASISDLQHLIISGLGKHAQLAYWARPAETWQMDKDQILKVLRAFTKRNGRVFVNSGWQQNYYHKHGIHSQVVYAGMDFDMWTDKGRRQHDKITIGFLVSAKKRKRFVDIQHVVEKFGDTFDYIAYGETNDQDQDTIKWLKHHREVNSFLSPNHFTIVNIYQTCDTWFAPTALEGFHNPPSEAALCGAMVLCSSARKAGTSDYATPETAVVYDVLENVKAEDFTPDPEKVAKMQEVLRTKIGTREQNMQRMVEMLK